MARIEIKNIGPIKEASFELNKVNVFMGPQSSGKSTIAKIISYCTWVEKRRMLDGFFREDFLGRLKSFHNLEDVYFPSDAFFMYEGDHCIVEFFMGKGHVSVEKDIPFENRKQIYIPAERNFVSSIPHLGRYKETNNNIMDFLYYWYEAKKSYPQNAALKIPELNVSFYHVEQEDRDVVVLQSGEEILLQSTSSGIQSMLPLYLLTDYLTDVLYRKEIVLSPFEREKLKEGIKPTIKTNVEKRVKELIASDESIHALNALDISAMESAIEDGIEKQLDTHLDATIKRLNYQCSQFIIEEPEQNLFPSTQRDLIYYMLHVLNESERDHRLTFTTHSPYILYAMNNCMMGYLVKDSMPRDEWEELLSKNSLINPDLVSIWQIKDGGIVDIKNKETGTVGKHYFNGIMNDVMEEYRDMLTYLKPEGNGK